MTLNVAAAAIAESMIERATEFRVGVSSMGETCIVDCGVKVPGGLQTGLQMARVALAGLADVALEPGPDGPMIQVFSDHPVRACLASQYAGWQVKVDSYFAMGSGPMRAAYGKEAIYEHFAEARETPPVAVGLLETRKLPPDAVAGYLREKLPATVKQLTLLAAPASSIAGTIQVVARSLETALHKLHILNYDLRRIVSGYGIAPLPPIGSDDIQAIGWTNDAILYGGRVVLWVRDEDDVIAEIGPKVPSAASAEHGSPFAELFQRYSGDFYKIDPMLFSPAEVTFFNLKTGRSFSFGKLEPEILHRSFQ